MAKKVTTEEVIEKIFDYTLEDIMGERFGSYSKYIIQDRAIPDARDGLKPVQRRILYSMYKERNTYDKGYRKSAKTVGDVIGNYHPHGDSSIYDAMVRMSQPWKTRLPYIDMHGNNGSIDGDSPAAYRYTEARLSKISNEMVRDIDKNTVLFAPNFDDTTVEPTVLPARFPALLVYGCQGISAGYATNIPPHNLGEVIDATVHRIDNPECRLDTLMNFVQGPDFPLGGIIEGKEGIRQAYETGKGKIIIKSKYEFEKDSIVITEIPYEVNKAMLVKKIDDIRIDKKIDGINEVRDESTSDIRIVIELKKGADKELVLNYLLKNTDLQITYNFNMVSIVNRRPKLLGLAGALDAFINHQLEVVKKRTEFDLEHAKARFHIVDGLIKCLSILDEVIKVIRASKNKADAKENLVKEFKFSEKQAEAIVMLQLYKLTNTDVVELEEEKSALEKRIEALEAILSSDKALKYVMKKELKEVKKEYAEDRITEIRDEITEIKIDKVSMISKDDFIVVTTNDGYVKKVSVKSYNMSESDETGLKPKDYVNGLYKVNNLDTILMFTNKGNYLFVPVYEIPEAKYKDIGKHINTIIKVSDGERIVKTIAINNFETNDDITIFTKNGMVKRCLVKDFVVSRFTKPVTAIKFKDDDEIVNVSLSIGNEVLIVSESGLALKYNLDEIPVIGLKASGVKAINLSNDFVINGFVINSNNEYVSLFTDKRTAKRVKISEITKTSRNKKGSAIFKTPKSNKYSLISVLSNNSKDEIGLVLDDEIKYIKTSEINIMDKSSVGGTITKRNFSSAFTKSKFKEFTGEIIKEENTNETLEQEDEPQMTLGDFYDDFKL